MTPDDVAHWDMGVIAQLFESSSRLGRTHHELGEALSDAQQRLGGWHGESGDEAREEFRKVRADVDGSGNEHTATAKAVQAAEEDVRTAKRSTHDVMDEAEGYGWTVTDNWTLDTSSSGGVGLDDTTYTAAVTRLQSELATAHSQAEAADQKMAALIRAAVGDAPLPQDGPNGQAGAITPGDQLPLAAVDGHKANPTEANAKHQQNDRIPFDGKGYLDPNVQLSPLLAGLSAQEWRDRLSHFKVGDPLPDPRSPTGDPRIDAIANAAAQQNSTYAWGGNRSLDGPSKGTLAGDPPTIKHAEGDAHHFADDQRLGYDCGGLVRYSVEQATPKFDPQTGRPLDVGQGTDAIDGNSTLTHVNTNGRIPSATISNAQADPGDILVFGGKTSGTEHTGIYIGNGFMIDAPGSGLPVRVDNLRERDPDFADVLRIPTR